ncbi:MULTISPECIES: hypothetical protein [Halomicrobium]|uniref:PAS domain-containing protein n=1 Tax=Halomicrobium mukohataei (strain ATCC 700874 / DSM 12286 / JCM 9738 / NCIMB 13541) TaxID=485914 RepID=C7P3V7_HALMD|nr:MULTISPECIES: hypothetical protein [Halomicrobium]ACV47779.1 hypothetical protein Hmuk_1665 [Halomicrobium mukohataei DSM 12286]
MTGVGVRGQRLVVSAVTLVCVALAVTGVFTQDTAVATVLVAAGTRRLRGVGGLLAGIVVGAVSGAAIGYVAVAFLGVPLAMSGAVGLGIALGGGIGVVTNYAATGDGEPVDETMTVGREPRRPTPTPADLFDDHPDPVLYVVDDGHGPVVRAANAAYAETFDVPADAVADAPLAEAVLAGEDADEVVTAVADGAGLDTVVTCETADGPRPFRVRTAGSGDDGYLVYTPRRRDQPG